MAQRVPAALRRVHGARIYHRHIGPEGRAARRELPVLPGQEIPPRRLQVGDRLPAQGKRGRLDDRFGAVRAPVRDIVGVGSQLPPSLPPVSNLCPRLHSDLHIPHHCFSPVGNLAVRQTQVRLSRLFRSTSQLSPTPSSTRVAGCAVLGDSKPIHAAERPDLRCLSPRAPGPREKPRCT